MESANLNKMQWKTLIHPVLHLYCSSRLVVLVPVIVHFFNISPVTNQMNAGAVFPLLLFATCVVKDGSNFRCGLSIESYRTVSCCAAVACFLLLTLESVDSLNGHWMKGKHMTAFSIKYYTWALSKLKMWNLSLNKFENASFCSGLPSVHFDHPKRNFFICRRMKIPARTTKTEVFFENVDVTTVMCAWSTVYFASLGTRERFNNT